MLFGFQLNVMRLVVTEFLKIIRTNIEYGFFIEWTHVSALTPDIPGHIVSH